MFNTIRNRANRQRGKTRFITAAVCAAGLAIAAGGAAMLAGDTPPNNQVCQSDNYSGKSCPPPPNLADPCSAGDAQNGVYCYSTQAVYANGSTCGYLKGSNCTTCNGTVWCWSFTEGVCQWDQPPGFQGPIPDCGKPYLNRISPNWMAKCN